MPFVQRVVEPKFLSRTSLHDADGHPLSLDDEFEAVTNSTLSNALRQLASLMLIANDIFGELNGELVRITERSECLKKRINSVEDRVVKYDPKKVAVPESDIGTFALLKEHYKTKHDYATNLFSPATRPSAVRELYEAAAKTPVHLMRQMDRWRRDGHRTSRFFMCTPVLGRRRKIRGKVDIDIETRVPATVEDLRRWTSIEAIGDVTVAPDGPSRIFCSTAATDGDMTDGTIVSDDEAIDHKLPSPEEQLQVVALKFPAEIVAVDVTGKSFDRMSGHRRSLLHADLTTQTEDGSTVRRRNRSRKPRSRRRNTLAGTDQKEIRDALSAGDEPQASAVAVDEAESGTGAVARSKSSDLLRKKDSPENKKSHFNTLKQWGKNRLKMITSYTGAAAAAAAESKDPDDVNIYETVTVRRKRGLHERKASCSSSENNSITQTALPVATVRMRDSSMQRRLRRNGQDEPHSSSGNWSASSESGRASIGSEITTTTQPKSTTSVTTSNNSLNQHAPSSVNSRRRFNISTSGSVTSEGTLTPDIIHDLHEDGETSSVYSCDTEGYYTSFHMDSGLKTLKEEDSPVTPLHSTSTFSHGSCSTAENEYELFGKGSTSTTTSSAGTVCTTLRASKSSLVLGPMVPERKSSLSSKLGKDKSPESSLERDFGSDKTGTVKRSPKATVVAVIHNGDVSPDSGHNTSSSPIESINSPNGVRSGSEFEFSESSDMEGADRIERIRVKTTINSSRIPSMCVITPSASDDEVDLNNLGSKNDFKSRMDLPIAENNNNLVSKVQVINVNPQTGYATIETKSSHRAPSPSGGTMTVNKEVPTKPPQLQPIFKATLMPLNNMFGRLKQNLSNLRRDSKSPVKGGADELDAGDYVTIADVKNNNEKSPNDTVNNNLKTVLSGKIRETEYISLNELPCNDPEGAQQCTADSLERRRRQGARVTLDAEGKVVYSSDSLKRRKGAHTTFEPGPFVKPPTATPSHSPLPSHRTPKPIRPVSQDKHQRGTIADDNQPLSPQLGRALSPSKQSPAYNTMTMPAESRRLYGYNTVIDSNMLAHDFERRCAMQYRTLPSKKSQMKVVLPERSVTPDITRGLDSNMSYFTNQPLHQNLGIPVQIPQVNMHNLRTFKISPIDPRNTGSFHSSTPSKEMELRAAMNLESKLLSPKKSTMSNEELYAAIHKSKKKMNISTDDIDRNSPVNLSPIETTKLVHKPETGYLGDKAKTRLSWSPKNGEYIDYNNKVAGSRQSWACAEKKDPQTSRLDFKKLLLMHGKPKISQPKKISAVEQLKISKQNIQPMPKPQSILDLSSSPRNLRNRKLAQNPPTSPEKPRPAPKLLSPRSQWRFANPRSDVLSSTILEDCHEDESSPNTSGKSSSSGGSVQSLKDRFERKEVSVKQMTASQRLQAQRAQFFNATPFGGGADGGSKGKASPPTLETSF